mgnify:CR=1 FL=1
MKYILDAENKAIGRVATQAAVFLMGKNDTGFARNIMPNTTVEIVNASKAKIFPARLLQKTYSRYSGYPGGLKQPTMAKVIDSKGYSELFREAISGMLPKNKLRSRMMAHLTVKE